MKGALMLILGIIIMLLIVLTLLVLMVCNAAPDALFFCATVNQLLYQFF